MEIHFTPDEMKEVVMTFLQVKFSENFLERMMIDVAIYGNTRVTISPVEESPDA